jgi:hypothetical protein
MKRNNNLFINILFLKHKQLDFAYGGCNISLVVTTFKLLKLLDLIKGMFMKLFEKYVAHDLNLKNHIVMAPMTRSRCEGNVPNDLVSEYYAQRAQAGLIITEGTSPSPNGLGYARIPGLFNEEQVQG